MSDAGTPPRPRTRVPIVGHAGRAIDALARGLSHVGGLLILGLMLLIVVDVALRAAIGQPLPGTIGFSQVIVAVAIYLAFAHTQRTGSNIRVELVMMRLPERPRRILEFVNRLIVTAASALLAFYAIRPALRSVRVNEHWVGAFIDVPMWPARFALVIGAAVLTLATIRMLFVGEARRDDEDETVKGEPF